MARYIDKTMICPCCKRAFEAKVLMSYSRQHGDMELDTYHQNPAIFDKVIFCPNCGFASEYPFTDSDSMLQDIVEKDDYQKMLHDKEFDSISKKLILAGYLAEEQEDFKRAGYNYLGAYWNLRESQSPHAISACQKALETFNLYLNTEMDVTAAMIFVDLLRQIGEFDEAFSIVGKIEPYLEGNPRLKDVASFEKKLIEARDRKPHKLREV